MAIKDLMKATKADRYTADGRDELNEALKADVEDRTYKTGEISEKTGLQKQPDGSWAPPKKRGTAPKMGSPEYNKKYGLTKKDVATGKEVDRIYEKQQNRIKELKAKGYTDEQIENDKIYQQTKEDMRNVGKSKPAENKPAGLQKTPGAQRGTKEFDKNEYIDSMKNSKNAPVSRMAREIQRETFDDEIKSTNGDKAKIESLTEKLLSPATQSGIKISAESRENAKNLVESRYRQLTVAENKPAENKPADMLSSKDPAILNKYKPETEEEENEIKKMQQFMEEETGATLRNAILARESYYNNSPSEYKNEAGKAALSNIKKIFGYGTQKDAAPKIRELTGDCKIRVRKA